jgi:hypothetical protein
MIIIVYRSILACVIIKLIHWGNINFVISVCSIGLLMKTPWTFSGFPNVLFSHLFTVIYHHIWSSQEYWHKTVSNKLSIHKINSTFRKLWVTYYSLWYSFNHTLRSNLQPLYSMYSSYDTLLWSTFFIPPFDYIKKWSIATYELSSFHFICILLILSV